MPEKKSVKKSAPAKAVKSAKKAGEKKAAQKKTPVKKTAVKKAVSKPEVKPAKKEFIVKCIFMIHVHRIGWIRTFFGGFLQYASVFEFIIIHLTSIVVLYQWMLSPFFKIRKFRIKDYIIFDRGKIENMVAFDRFNCEFCGYANGIARLWNDELDAIAESELGRGKFFLKFISGLYALFIGIFLFFNFFFSKVLYFLISLFLGLHWTSNTAIFKDIINSGYAEKHNLPMKWLLRFAKLYAYTLGTNLEQIESQWCPIKHLERKNQVLPEHHRNFFDRKDLAEMYETLEKDGSASPMKPKY